LDPDEGGNVRVDATDGAAEVDGKEKEERCDALSVVDVDANGAISTDDVTCEENVAVAFGVGTTSDSDGETGVEGRRFGEGSTAVTTSIKKVRR